MNRRRKIKIVKETLQWSARFRSADGMTGVRDDRAEGIALDIVEALDRAEEEEKEERESIT